MKRFFDLPALHIGLLFIVIVSFWALFVRFPLAMTGLIAVIALGIAVRNRLSGRH